MVRVIDPDGRGFALLCVLLLLHHESIFLLHLVDVVIEHGLHLMDLCLYLLLHVLEVLQGVLGPRDRALLFITAELGISFIFFYGFRVGCINLPM
jgi:hypothetical protein